MLRSGLCRNRLLNRLVGSLYSRSIPEIQLHAAHIGLVRDRLRMQLEHNRITQLLGLGDSLLSTGRDLRLDHRNTIGLKNLLSLEFRQNCAALFANSL